MMGKHNMISFGILYAFTILMGITGLYAVDTGDMISLIICFISCGFVFLWLIVNFIEEVRKIYE